MWLWAILFDLDSSSTWLQVLLWLGSLFAGAFAYNRYSSGRRILIDNPELLNDLSAEERLRLELGLIDTSPELAGGDVVNAQEIDQSREIARVISQAREESRRRQRGDLDGLKPADLSRLRLRMDHVLRERWHGLVTVLNMLREDVNGESWRDLVDGDAGAMFLIYDLAAEVQAAKRQATFPPVALQLEGPLITLHQVLTHAQQSYAADAHFDTAHSLRASVTHFLKNTLPGICHNIDETAMEGVLDEETKLAYDSELGSQDLPTA